MNMNCQSTYSYHGCRRHQTTEDKITAKRTKTRKTLYHPFVSNKDWPYPPYYKEAYI